MLVKKTLSFTEEEVQTMIDFNEEVLNPICKALKEDCTKCPFDGYCCRIGGFIETVTIEGHWIQEEEK